MASLYDIDQQILDCIDPETGEIIDVERLEQLQIDRNAKIENVALWVKNLTADVNAYKAEKDSFAKKEKQAKAKIESLKKWLTAALNGQSMNTTRVNVSFRKSKAVEIYDPDFFAWCTVNGRNDLLNWDDPKPNKTAIKHELERGEEIDGAEIVEKQNIQIK